MNQWNAGSFDRRGMNIYLYSDIPSNGARDLIASLGGTRLRKFDGMDFWRKKRRVQLNPGDVVICWGKLLPKLEGIRILNSGTNKNKVEEMWELVNAGVPTVTIGSKPGLNGFIARSKYHVGGNDLLTPTSRPDFWVKKETLVREYRIHSFNQRSIRAGVKQPRDGFTIAPDEASFKMGVNAHPWIRSYDGGWRINYDDFQSNKGMREIAHQAIKALGLDFGAVDIGEREDGSRIVLEVNKAPGLEGGTIEAYKRTIEKWIAEGTEVKTEAKAEAKPEAPAREVPYENPLDAREARYGRPRFNPPAPPPGQAEGGPRVNPAAGLPPEYRHIFDPQPFAQEVARAGGARVARVEVARNPPPRRNPFPPRPAPRVPNPNPEVLRWEIVDENGPFGGPARGGR